MIILDLFSGTGSSTEAFTERGHDVFTIEMNPVFPATMTADLMTVTPRDVVEMCGGWPDFIWASPPCTSYSVGSFRHHWRATSTCRNCSRVLVRVSGERWEHEDGDCETPNSDGSMFYEPKSDTGRLGRNLLLRTFHLIEVLEPSHWLIENPRALMRKMPVLAGVDRKTITHCQYGDPRRMKPTDLFGVFPTGFTALCCINGDPCHEAAPRGAKTGTQGLNSRDAGMMPPLLGMELCAALELEVGA
jgi:site-specific DNA-cytosine methylase